MALQDDINSLVTGAPRRRPTGAITQIDPGVYRDASGGYFTGTSMDDAQYRGDTYINGAFGGAPAPTPTAAPPPERQYQIDGPPQTRLYPDGTGVTSAGPTNATSGGGTLPGVGTSGISYEQALSGANQYAQQYWGRPLAEADIAKMKQTLGYIPGAPIDSRGQQAIIDYIRGSGSNLRPSLTAPGLSTPNFGATEFDDPAAKLLEQLTRDRIARLGNAPSRPNLDVFTQALQAKGQTAEQRAQEFATTARTRASELNGPAFSQQDEAALRAGSFDALERRRQETLKNNREDIYARGFAPTSGLAQDSDNQTNKAFETSRTQIESDLLRSMIQESQRRKDQAVQLEALAQQALAGGDTTSLNYLAQIADFEDSLIRDTDSRELSRISSAGIPIDLENQRTQLALQILGQGGNPQGILSSLLGIANQGTQAQALNLAGRNSNMTGLGLLSSYLTNALR